MIFFFDLRMIYVSSTDFCTPLPNLNFIEFCPVVAELFLVKGRTDRQTELTKLMFSVSFAFRTRVKAGKKMRAREKGNNRNDKSL